LGEESLGRHCVLLKRITKLSVCEDFAYNIMSAIYSVDSAAVGTLFSLRNVPLSEKPYVED